MNRPRGFPATTSNRNAKFAEEIGISKPNKYVIRTTALTPGVRTRYFFATREAARRWCAQYLVPRSIIKKNE